MASGTGKRAGRALGVALLASLLLSLAVPAGGRGHAASSGQVNRLRQEIREVKRRLDALEDQRRSAQLRLSALQRQQRQLSEQLQVLDRDLEATEARLARKQEELRLARQDLARARAELARVESQLRHRQRLRDVRVRALYEHGTVGVLDVLLGARSFTDFLVRFGLLQEVLQHDLRLLEETRRLRDQVDAKRRELEARHARIARLVAEIDRDRRELERAAAAKQAALERVREDRAAVERLLDETDAQLNALTRRLTELYRELQRLLPRVTGKLHFPLDPSAPWRVTSEFGMRYHPILRRPRMHTGIDLAAPKGTRVLAAADGQVGYAGWLGGYGLTIILVHGGDLQTVYAHLSAILVQEGQRVEAGQTIGRVGSTGFSTGPHLHFEVRRDGKPVDPRPYLAFP